MRFVIAALLAVTASVAQAQQYQNYEIQPDGSGGYCGTRGNRNFEVYPENGSTSGHVGGRRPGVRSERPSYRPGSVGATQKSCVVDANGEAFCR